MKMKRLTTLLLVVVVLSSLLAACAPATPEVVEKEIVVEKEVPVTVEVEKEVVVEKEVPVTVEVEAGGLPESPTIEEVQKRGVLRVGVVPSAPCAYKDPTTGDLIGYCLTLCREAANRLGVDIQFTESSWDGIIAGLQAEKYEIAACGLMETKQRKEAIDFVDVYYAGFCFLVDEERTDLNEIEDLNNPEVTVGTVQGSAAEVLLEEGLPKANILAVPTTGGAGAPAELLISGRADAIQVDDVAAESWRIRYCGTKIVPPGCCCWEGHPFATPIGWGIRKGDQGWQLFWEELAEDYKQLITDERDRFRKFEYRFPGEPTPVCD
jgi:ABC-type amino acid transport substrate-binding protein